MRLFFEFKGKRTRMAYNTKTKTFYALTVANVNLSNSSKNNRAPRQMARVKNDSKGSVTGCVPQTFDE
jgi:hypothetical protein